MPPIAGKPLPMPLRGATARPGAVVPRAGATIGPGGGPGPSAGPGLGKEDGPSAGPGPGPVEGPGLGPGDSPGPGEAPGPGPGAGPRPGPGDGILGGRPTGGRAPPDGGLTGGGPTGGKPALGGGPTGGRPPVGGGPMPGGGPTGDGPDLSGGPQPIPCPWLPSRMPPGPPRGADGCSAKAVLDSRATAIMSASVRTSASYWPSSSMCLTSPVKTLGHSKSFRADRVALPPTKRSPVRRRIGYGSCDDLCWCHFTGSGVLQLPRATAEVAKAR
jgi:hypothetical protein